MTTTTTSARGICSLVAMILVAGIGCGGGNSGGSGSGGSGGSGAGSGGAGGPGSGGQPAGSGGAGNNGNVDAGAATGDGGTVNDGGSGNDGNGDAGAAPANVFLYVSGYGSGNVAIYRFDTTSGALTAAGSATAGGTPTYSVAAASGKFLYVADEASAAAVTAFAIGPAGALTRLNNVKTGGAGTAHMTLSPDGKWIVTADYDSDSIAVVAINNDGSLGAVSDTQPGCPAAHNVQFDRSDPNGKFLLAACKSDTGKATPRILQFSFAAGKLTPASPAAVMFGADPRHMTFDAARTHLYVITEESNQLFWFDYDSTTGKIANPQMVSALPAGGMVGAGGHIAFGGAFLYAANRTDGSLGIFSIGAGGKPQNGAWQRMGAADVREFSFDPTGKFLVAANQTSSQVTVFAVDGGTGKLTPVGTPTNVGSQAATATFAAF